MVAWVLDLLLVAGTLGAGALILGSWAGWRATRAVTARVRRAVSGPPKPVPLIGVRAPPVVGDDEDLYVCPRRLEALEARLGERLGAVGQQAGVLRARQAELEQKGRRDDLARKYADDLALLERRAAGMRRVLGLVWKTRSILLVRAHLAQTARRRPNLGRLPDADSAAGRPVLLRDGTATYHGAASAVRDFLSLVERRATEIGRTLPAAPADAEIDAAARAAVEAEVREAEAAYAHLREDMDRLGDNLTWLGDHFATLAVVEASAETVGPDAGPAELIREVEDALGQLAELARAVDPAVADRAVTNLAEDITQLEAAGLEAQAEADAELEVAKLLRSSA